MNRRVKATICIVVAVCFCSVVVGLVVSKAYWGYWWKPPTLGVIGEIAKVESFAAIWPRGTYGHQPPAGQAAFKTAAQYGQEDDPSFPLGRIPAALAACGLSPTTEDSSAANLFQPALRVLEQRGLLVHGDPGYEYARTLEHAYLAVAVTHRGSRVLVLSTHGGQVSNDHFPQYEAAFTIHPSGALEPLELHRYFFDVAGIEGVTAGFVAVAAAIPLSALGLFTFGLLLGLKAV